MMVGDLLLRPLGLNEKARVKVEPERNFDFGAGAGKAVEKEINGGTVGLILDARGRAIGIPEDRQKSRELISNWVTALELYT